jgi:AraC-like DNA-binding protein/quercetin dioxygenase-like cupin family protein
MDMRSVHSWNVAYPDTIARYLAGLRVELGKGDATVPHNHRKTELLYTISGQITVATATGVYRVPQSCALWIPAGVVHSTRSHDATEAGLIFIELEGPSGACESCELVFGSSLLRELILRIVRSESESLSCDREARLAAVLLDEVQASTQSPLNLSLPADARLRRVTNALIETPSRRTSLSEWGRVVGASERTLSRLFRKELGMSFVKWRQQLHVSMATQRLAQRKQVRSIAFELGYEGPSAFIEMFRNATGVTPAQYLKSGISSGLR